ncbi:hypothetical protein [Amycolatopsis sp. WQ 127309]|uniref:hypothetical protein n=1 Tax=Amycolatopsis sp. WQ 127309 TaxID=2932773 RepID=UPI001FF2B056|nr:hypothetical protein [Amycolatopsis sp. WQ 127309]UOZ08721.1 hypothetical protein MUY22_10785 [Amycolatopsis sp. WQ 127309]
MNFRFGDKVLVRESALDGWAPGRVVRVENVDSRPRHRCASIKVATSSLLRDGYLSGLRVVPAGTPIYQYATLDEVSLVRHDSRWDPFGVKPFMTPDEYRVMGGVAGFPMTGMPGATHVGAYQSATSYDPGDPVWAWERGWRRAEVMAAKPSWVTVHYLDGYRCENGRPTKSYRPSGIWPVICDYPEPIREIEIEPEWLRKPEPLRRYANGPH